MLDQNYWDSLYASGQTGWDIGYVSTPLKEYFDQLENKDQKILIPGAGNAYEVEYLHNKGFTNVFVLDIASRAIQSLKTRVPAFPEKHLIHGDFFDHNGQYELIIEQTFFCALDPTLRSEYVEKIRNLLLPDGKLAGVLFSTLFPFEGPPFGGTKEEYEKLFSPFLEASFEPCYNSIAPRMGSELFMIARR